MLRNYEREAEKLVGTIAHLKLKEKKRLLINYGDVYMFGSLRPKIGKRFQDEALEKLKCALLNECRAGILPISIEEVDKDITHNHSKLEDLFGNMAASDISQQEYMQTSNKIQRKEVKISNKIRTDHERKINHFVKKLNVDSRTSQTHVKPEKKIKHPDLKRTRKIERHRTRNQQKRDNKREQVSTQIQSIKESNLVHNFSSLKVPDSAYMFLALGSSFVPSKCGSKHDDIYDIKMFARKLRWTSFLMT